MATTTKSTQEFATIFDEINARALLVLEHLQTRVALLKGDVDASDGDMSMRAWGLCRLIQLLRAEGLTEKQRAAIAHLSVHVMPVVARVGAAYATAGPLEILELTFVGGRLPPAARAWVLDVTRVTPPAWIAESREHDRERERLALDAQIAARERAANELDQLKARRAALAFPS